VTKNTIYNLSLRSVFAQYGVYLETLGGASSNVTVTGNTIAGFSAAGSNPNTVHYSDPSTIPNVVLGPNKILIVPPAGAYK
jgi:hypothetical protein